VKDDQTDLGAIDISQHAKDRQHQRGVTCRQIDRVLRNHASGSSGSCRSRSQAQAAQPRNASQQTKHRRESNTSKYVRSRGGVTVVIARVPRIARYGRVSFDTKVDCV